MDAQDKSFMARFLMVLGVLVIFTVVVFMLARLLSTVSANKVKTSEAYQKQKLAQIGERLQKVGSVETFDPSATPKVRSGKEIFGKVCTTCHTPGVLNAPKLGDAAAWKPRLANGFDALVNNALHGKGSMPPRGGDASLSDDEVRKTIVYMLKEAGLEASASASPTKDQASNNSAASDAASSRPASEANAPSAPAGEAAKADAPDQPAAREPEQPEAASEKGAGIVKTVCFACHGTGVAGAPKLGDKAAWEPRIATGKEALYHSALKGKGAMPPKGGRLDLPDEDIKAAVDFLVSQAR